MHVLRHPRFTPFPYTTLFRSIQFPIARAYANVRAADLMRYDAARLFDAGRPAGAEANLAKLLAADASWEAANACLQTFGGFEVGRASCREREWIEWVR